jgi:CRP/FNR family transcriptional regulator, polysaccharide utilization system transcription regulator
MRSIDKPDYLNNCYDCAIKMLLFKFLSKDELELLNRDRLVMQFSAGELIYKQGSSYTHIMSLTSGLVKLYFEDSGRKIITRFIRPTEFIGGPGMYIDNKHHNSASAVEDSTLCFLNLNNFKSVIRQNGIFAEGLLKIISSKTMPVFERVISLSIKQMPGLVAEALIYLSEYVYKNNAFNLTVSRQDIAEYCGLTTESVIRTCKTFKDDKLIKLQGNYLEIIDYDKLKHIIITG